MSWKQLLPPDRVKWERDGPDYYPVWPSEPDVAAIKEIVASALPQEEEDFTVDFLAEGAHHKVYEISHSAWSTTYIFRIALAVDPRLKVESEMATLLFLKQKTSIPAPNPIAWSSSVHEKLGYEWALLEKLPGVGLDDVWDQVPWEKKEEIIDTIAGFLVQLWAPNMRFASIGSLYPGHSEFPSHQTEQTSPEEPVHPRKDTGFEEEPPTKVTITGAPFHTIEETVSEELVDLQLDIGPEESSCPVKDNPPEISYLAVEETDSELFGHSTKETGEETGSQESYNITKKARSNDPAQPTMKTNSEELAFPTQETCSQESIHHTFMVGPMVDDCFWHQRRLHLSVNRGPYESCHDWLAARIHIEEEYIRTAKVLLENRQEMTPEHKAEDWDTMAEEIGLNEQDIADEYDTMIATCLDYQRVLPLLFPQTETPQDGMLRFVLSHADLRDGNILVDPESYTITGILDWEQTCAKPDWYGVDYPLLIESSDPISDGEPPVPKTYDQDSPEYDWGPVAERFRWEAKLLRGRFDQTVQQLLDTKEWRPASAEDHLKSKFLEGVPDLYDNSPGAKYTIERIIADLQALEPAESQGDQLEHA